MPIAIKNHSYPPTLKIVLQYTASLFKKKERKKERGKRKKEKKKKKRATKCHCTSISWDSHISIGLLKQD